MAENTLSKLQEQYGDRITADGDGSVTWTLGIPLVTDAGKIGTVTLRRPKLKEIKAMKGRTDTEKTAWIISTLTGIAPPFLDELDGEDFAVLGRIFAHFMGVSPVSGGE